MRKTNAVLTTGIFVSLICAIVIPILCSSLFWAGVDMGSVTAFTLCGLPFFFLQWRLCRAQKAKWVKWIPLGVISFLAIVSVIQVAFNQGSWDSLLGWIGLIFCMAPAAGMFLGWMAHGKKTAFIGVATAVIAYLIANRVPLLQRPIELTDVAAAIVLTAGICLLFKKVTKEQIAE